MTLKQHYWLKSSLGDHARRASKEAAIITFPLYIIIIAWLMQVCPGLLGGKD